MTSVSTPAPSLSLATIPLWIDGAPCEAHTALFGQVMNPTKGEPIRRVPLADEADVDRAVRSAAAAFPEWRATSPLRRARILTRFRELLAAHQAELAALVSEEHGKVFQDAMGSVQRGIEVVEFAAGAPHLLKGEFAASVGRDVDAYSRRQPLGVCVGITPFNFPVMVPLWMFPVALVCGNTFVLKPSERDPSASVRMAELLKEAGLPAARQDGCRCAPEASEGEGGLVRGLDTCSALCVHDVCWQRETCAGTRRREEPCRCHAGCGPQLRVGRADRCRVRLGGRAVHGDFSRCGGRGHRRSTGIEDCREGAGAEDRRARRFRLRHGTADYWCASRQSASVHRRRRARRCGARRRRSRTGRRWPRAWVLPRSDTLRPGLDRDDHLSRRDLRTSARGAADANAGRSDRADQQLSVRERHGHLHLLRCGRAPLRRGDRVGMVGINVPIPVPMAFFSFGGWKQSLFGDLHVYGSEGIQFYTRTKAITARWPDSIASSAGLHMPTLA